MLKQKLTNYQVTALTAVNIIGIIILTLPRLAAEGAETAAGLLTLATGLFSVLMLVLLVVLCRRFPGLTMIEFSQVILGKFLGKIYGALFAVYTLLVAGTVLRGFADALKVLLLQRTPLEFIMISMLIVVVYQVVHGISSISKVSELFLPAIVVTIGFLLLYNAKDIELYRFRPVIAEDFVKIILSMPKLVIAYLGYEIVFFLSPFMKDRKKLMKTSLIGVIIPTVIYTALAITATGVNGAKTIKETVYPTIMLAKRIGVPGFFAGRFDIIFIVFWILAAFTTIVIYLYMSSISLTRILGLRSFKPFTFILMPFVYLIAIIPRNIVQISALNQIAGVLGMIVLAGSIPILIIAVIRKKGGNEDR